MSRWGVMMVAGVVTVLVAGTGGSVAARPATPARLPQGAQLDTQYGCIVCHADKRRAFVLGVHASAGIRCRDCHGGDTTAVELPAAHGGRFLGAPDKIETLRLCSSCHGDPGKMRPYGLPTDQLAQFRTSRHGQLLLGQRNFDAPTCSDCHDAHTILPPEDARSRVYPTNTPATCARCHQDQGLMAKYGIPTNQVEQYRAGAHGVAVFERHNFAAPTCVGCHGSHGALPPAVTEIASVCDRCHVLLGKAFYGGPHGAPARTGKLRGCLACHSNHSTERVAPAEISTVCRNCHQSSTQAALMGVEIQADVVRATQEMHQARRAIDELVRHGRNVTDARFRYATAFTDYQEIALVQHSLDLEQLNDLSRSVASISREIRGTAEVSGERRWEHKLLLIPVWFLALSALALARFKLGEVRRRGGE